MRINTVWSVLTGGPCSGKTTLKDRLQTYGWKGRREAATFYIKSQRALGRADEEIFADQVALNRSALELMTAWDGALDPTVPHILDRGIADVIAYCRSRGMDDTPYVQAAHGWRYQRVFHCELLPFTENGVRYDEEFARQLCGLLYDVYRELDYEVIRVPALPIDERVKFVIGHL